MSEVILGVGASHSTLMNTHWDQVIHRDRAERFRDALRSARDLIAEAAPDSAILIGSNHFRGLWLDLMPAFTVGIGEVTASGEAMTPAGSQEVDLSLARQVCSFLIEDSFDLAFSARLQIDHGLTHAIQYLLEGVEAKIVPLIINVFAPPLPTLSRCQELGGALARAIRSDGENKRVVVIGSGGLSHRLPFPDWQRPESTDDHFLVEAWLKGRTRWSEYEVRRRQIILGARAAVNPEFDREFLRRVADGSIAEISTLSSEQLEAMGGNGAQEIRSWVMMSAACGHVGGRSLAYEEMPEWLTGMAVAVVEPTALSGAPSVPSRDGEQH